MTTQRAGLARNLLRKLEQAAGHADGLRAALGRGENEAAWEQAVLLRRTTIAARRLEDQYERVEKRERRE